MESNRVASLRKIVVTGPVGVGKSTFLDNLASYFDKHGVKYITIPEYITGDLEGPNMLNKYFNRLITPYEFQAYIIEYYTRYLVNLNQTIKDLDSDTILLFERGVDDSVLCFGNILYNKHEISLNEYYNLYHDAVSTSMDFNIPSYFNRHTDDYSFMLLKTLDGVDYSKIILDVIQNSKDDLVIGLYNDDKVCYDRVVRRNRDGEDAYSYQSIKEFNQRYNDMYDYIIHKEDIPFTSIGLAFPD